MPTLECFFSPKSDLKTRSNFKLEKHQFHVQFSMVKYINDHLCGLLIIFFPRDSDDDSDDDLSTTPSLNQSISNKQY